MVASPRNQIQKGPLRGALLFLRRWRIRLQSIRVTEEATVARRSAAAQRLTRACVLAKQHDARRDFDRVQNSSAAKSPSSMCTNMNHDRG
jgi:hypothetical protein